MPLEEVVWWILGSFRRHFYGNFGDILGVYPPLSYPHRGALRTVMQVPPCHHHAQGSSVNPFGYPPLSDVNELKHYVDELKRYVDELKRSVDELK